MIPYDANNYVLDISIREQISSIQSNNIWKHDNRMNPGNRYKYICQGTSITIRLPGQITNHFNLYNFLKKC